MLQLAYKEDPPPIRHPLEATFEQHHGMVFRTAYRLTGNAADAEDVLQTVFLRLLKRVPDSPEFQQPESYLRRAAINASLDLIRERIAKRTHSSASGDPACEPNPEFRYALRQALAALDPRQAEMFVLRYFEGHSNAEIARLLDTNPFTVAVNLHRTRRRLQGQLNF